MDRTELDRQDRLEKIMLLQQNQASGLPLIINKYSQNAVTDDKEEPFFDPSVLASIKFKQGAERKCW